MPRTAWRLIGLILVAAAFAACGDPPTSDHRGYTKAPLERPGIRITPERPSNYRQFVHLNKPDGERLTLPDSTG